MIPPLQISAIPAYQADIRRLIPPVVSSQSLIQSLIKELVTASIPQMIAASSEVNSTLSQGLVNIANAINANTKALLSMMSSSSIQQGVGHGNKDSKEANKGSLINESLKCHEQISQALIPLSQVLECQDFQSHLAILSPALECQDTQLYPVPLSSASECQDSRSYPAPLSPALECQDSRFQPIPLSPVFECQDFHQHQCPISATSSTPLDPRLLLPHEGNNIERIMKRTAGAP
ncbi:hypothetical protein MMC14_007347 [Varicellaria rhodocarpa]|nr:hypothetical protein [Varicellaria rhodocarpa]